MPSRFSPPHPPPKKAQMWKIILIYMHVSLIGYPAYLFQNANTHSLIKPLGVFTSWHRKQK